MLSRLIVSVMVVAAAAGVATAPVEIVEAERHIMAWAYGYDREFDDGDEEAGRGDLLILLGGWGGND